MARRTNGEGSVSLRSDGSWQGALQIDGRRRIVYGRNRRDAVAKLEALRRDSQALAALPERHTLGDLFSQWLAAGTPRWAPNTLHDYQYYTAVVLAIVPPTTTLQRVTPARLQSVLLAHQETPRTAQLLYHVLHAAFGLGVRWGWLPANPVERLVRPAGRPKRREWWTPEQCGAFLAATAETRWGPLWATALGTGLRLGELLSLRWCDVQWERAVIRVERTGGWLNGEWQEKAPKTTSGRRTIPLTTLALSTLRRHRAAQAGWRLRAGGAWQDTGLVFTTLAGGPLRRFEVARTLRNAVRRLALPSITVHGMRHLAASLALEGGAPLPLVSRHLGHADTGITARVYSHAVGDGLAVVTALEYALDGGFSHPARHHGEHVVD